MCSWGLSCHTPRTPQKLGGGSRPCQELWAGPWPRGGLGLRLAPCKAGRHGLSVVEAACLWDCVRHLQENPHPYWVCDFSSFKTHDGDPCSLPAEVVCEAHHD